MKRRVYEILIEPRGQTYQALLSAALRWCDQFLLVDVPEPDFGPNDSAFRGRARSLIDQLAPYLVEVSKQKSWPGSTLSERKGVDVYARVYRFRLVPESTMILSGSADGLYSWRAPAMPSDLSLLRKGGDPWLVNMAADEESYLVVTQEEAEELLVAAPGLKIKEQYEH